MSGRNLSRYFAVLETPLVVQCAVRDRRLKLTLGARITTLPEERQEEIAEIISAIPPEKKVNAEVAAGLGVAPSHRHVWATDALTDFVRHVGRGLEDLDERLDEIGAQAAAAKLPTLKAASVVILKLIAIGSRLGAGSGHRVRRRA